MMVWKETLEKSKRVKILCMLPQMHKAASHFRRKPKHKDRSKKKYALVGTVGYKHKNIKTLRSSLFMLQVVAVSSGSRKYKDKH